MYKKITCGEYAVTINPRPKLPVLSKFQSVLYLFYLGWHGLTFGAVQIAFFPSCLLVKMINLVKRLKSFKKFIL